MRSQCLHGEGEDALEFYLPELRPIEDIHATDPLPVTGIASICAWKRHAGFLVSSS
jgi:hypothetical protein